MRARHARAAVGQRNHALFIAAQNLGQLVAGGSLAAEEVTTLLEQAAAGHVAAGAYTAREATNDHRLRAPCGRPAAPDGGRMTTPPAGLDWHSTAHWGGGRRLPCRHCGRPAFCRDDQGAPAHKVCAELAASEAPTTDYREVLSA